MVRSGAAWADDDARIKCASVNANIARLRVTFLLPLRVLRERVGVRVLCERGSRALTLALSRRTGRGNKNRRIARSIALSASRIGREERIIFSIRAAPS